MALRSSKKSWVSWLSSLLLVLAGFGLCSGQTPAPSPPSSVPFPAPIPANDDPSVALVSTGLELADALANPNKTWAILVGSIVVNETDFAAYPQPIPRVSNFTITGQPGPETAYPVLGLGFVKAKIRLENATSLTLQYVVVRDFRATPLGQSPGFDLVASSTAEAGALVLMQDSVLMLRICVPRTIQGEIMSSIPRPPGLPGTQVSISNVTQSGCTNSTTAPPVSRCWPDLGVYADVAVAGFDIDAFGRATATRYTLYMVRVPYLCERQMTDECVAALGPLGCFLYMFPRTPINTPPSTSPSPSPKPVTASPSSSSDAALPAIIAGVVGGVVLVAVVAVGAWLLMRRKRQRQEAERKAAYEEARVKVVQADAAKAQINGKHPPGGPGGPGSPPNSTGGPPSSSAQRAHNAGTPDTGSFQQNQSAGRNIILPSGVGTCVLSSSADVDASSPLVIVTPFTPTRSDLKLDVQCDTEVKLLPIIRGKGSYGRVVEGLYGGQRVAVKLVVDVDEWSGPTDSLVGSFAQEVEVLGRCQHPNIVRLLAACLKPPRLCLVMELMDTSLERLVHGKPGELLPLPTVLHVAADIARGLAYLHPTIVHRDLKPGNVLLSNTELVRPIAKLTDFGLSRLRSTVLVTRHPEAGTPAYMAPEAFDASNYVITHKADIYALGVILWEMLTGSVPWEGCSMVAIAYSITVRHHRLPLSKLDANRCPPKLRKLIHQCWDPDPQRRPAAAELVKQLTLVLQLVQGEQDAPISAGSMSRNYGNIAQMPCNGGNLAKAMGHVPSATAVAAAAAAAAATAAATAQVVGSSGNLAGVVTDGSSLSSAPAGGGSSSRASVKIVQQGQQQLAGVSREDSSKPGQGATAGPAQMPAALSSSSHSEQQSGAGKPGKPEDAAYASQSDV